jgi:chromosome segregation ATPase
MPSMEQSRVEKSVKKEGGLKILLKQVQAKIEGERVNPSVAMTGPNLVPITFNMREEFDGDRFIRNLHAIVSILERKGELELVSQLQDQAAQYAARRESIPKLEQQYEDMLRMSKAARQVFGENDYRDSKEGLTVKDFKSAANAAERRLDGLESERSEVEAQIRALQMKLSTISRQVTQEKVKHEEATKVIELSTSTKVEPNPLKIVRRMDEIEALLNKSRTELKDLMG